MNKIIAETICFILNFTLIMIVILSSLIYIVRLNLSGVENIIGFITIMYLSLIITIIQKSKKNIPKNI